MTIHAFDPHFSLTGRLKIHKTKKMILLYHLVRILEAMNPEAGKV